MDNIPQFEALKGLKDTYNTAKNASIAAEKEVTTATEAYQTAAANTVAAKEAYENDPNHAATIRAKQEYDDAVAESKNLEDEYKAAVEEVKRLTKELSDDKATTENMKGLYEKAEKAVEDFTGVKTTPTKHENIIKKQVPISLYTDFYNAIFGEYDYENGASNNITLYYGMIKKASSTVYTIVFAPNDIPVSSLGISPISSFWKNENMEITVNSVYEDGDDFDDNLSQFIYKGNPVSINKLKVRFYYKDDENDVQYGETEELTSTNVENLLQAFIVGYEKIKIEKEETEITWTDEDSDEYAKVKKDRDEALANWNAAKAAEAAKEKELSDAKDAKDKALSNLNGYATLVQNKYNAWQTALDNEKPTREKWEAAQKAEEDALAAVTAAEKKKENADNAVETAKKNYNSAAELLLGDDEIKYDDDDLIVCEAYTTIDIIADFTEGVSTITEWPAGYTLNGNGHIIETTSALFVTNKGTINNLATPNGHIADENKEGGKVSLCLTKWDDGYHVYKESGTSASFDTAEDAIYSMRNTAKFKFGYDVQKKKVTPLEDENGNYKLYEGKYTNTKQEPTSFKFNISNSSWKINQNTLNEMVTDGKAINENAIFYIENNDAIGTGIENVKNIAIKGENTTSPYTCNNVELKDADAAREFYIPMNFIAQKVTYGRNFNKKYAAVCFPFTLTTTMQEELGIDAAYQFKEVKEGVMWFSLLDEAPANQPCLIVFKDEKFKENNIPGVILNEYATNGSFLFKATPDELVATDTHGEKTFYGTYKLSSVKGLLGNNSTDAIYGIVDGELVKMTGDNTKFKAFRGYVRTPEVSTTAGAPSFKIGLMDEDGNELSTAIETVSGEIVTGFKAKGGDNAIEIITDKACQVKVYALNGALVKSTRVETGVTSLPVKAGMYVVNGAKVIVK